MSPKKRAILVSSVFLSLTAAAMTAEVPLPFIRGDADGSGTLDVTDPVGVLQFLFSAGEEPGCLDACDVTDDGRLSITDPIFLLRHLFMGGSAPPAPSGACGLDPTDDALGCGAFGNCPVEVPCVSEEDVNGLLGGSIEPEFCLPAGALSIPSDSFTISVCPADKADPCGVLEDPGCPVQITKIAGRIDVAGSRIVIRVEGRMEDLPVDLETTLFGTTTCTTDFHGASADLPFSFDVVVPLVLEERKPGDYEILGIGESAVENVDLRLTAKGGLVCTLFQAGQSVLVTPIVGILEEALKSLTAALPQELEGLRVCASGGGQ